MPQLTCSTRLVQPALLSVAACIAPATAANTAHAHNRTCRTLQLLCVCLALLCTHLLSAQAFRNPRRIATPTTPSRVMAADVNGDGLTDIVYVDSNQGFALHSALLRPDGSYVETTVVQLPNTIPECILQDVNGDGFPDVVCEANQSYVNVLLNRGDGSFTAPTPSATPDYGYQPVAVGDLNRDGFPDIVLVGGDRTN